MHAAAGAKPAACLNAHITGARLAWPQVPTRVSRKCRATAAQESALQSLASMPLLTLPHVSPEFKCAGVYGLYDSELNLQYVGVSRDVDSSLAAGQAGQHARALLLPGATKQQLQAAWKAAIKEHGSIPPGNQPGAERTAPATRPAPAGPSMQRPDASTLNARVQAASNAWADRAITPQVLTDLCQQGWVVVDGVLPLELLSQARAGAQMLRASGLMAQVASQSSQGRLDEILVLGTTDTQELRIPQQSAAASQLLNTPQCQALSQVASFLTGIPCALLRHPQQPSSGAWQLPALAVSQSLQLAVYSAGGYYVRHVDNDSPEGPDDADRGSAAWAGPAGQRVRDRCVTALVYFNDKWNEATDGGCLRLYHADATQGSPASPHTDISPVCGRLVLFQSRLLEHEVLPAQRERWALSAWIPSLAACME